MINISVVCWLGISQSHRFLNLPQVEVDEILFNISISKDENSTKWLKTQHDVLIEQNHTCLQLKDTLFLFSLTLSVHHFDHTLGQKY